MPNNTAEPRRIGLPVIQPGGPERPAPTKRSGRGKIRALVLIAVHLVVLLHVTHFWIAGRTLSPVEPSESMATLELGHLNAGAIFFALAIASTAVFGRFFCGWGCHLVALQDLCGYLLRRIGLRPKPLRSRLLVFVPFALAFYMFLWPTTHRLWRGDPHPGLSSHLMTSNFWQTFPGPAVSILTFVVCGGLIVYLLGNKGFCTYACPYGAFFSMADRLAAGRIRVTDACHQCGQCTAHCTSNVQVHAEVRDFGMVVNPGCMKCMDCVSVCPNGALYYGLAPRREAGRSGALAAGPREVPRQKKVYDFSLPEELAGLAVTAFSVFALRGLYGVLPLLLSVALAVITAYLAIQTVRLFRRRDLRLQHLQLRRNHRLTATGWGVALLLGAWFAFNLHSGFVQFHRYRGQWHLNRVPAGWIELLSGDAQAGYSSADRASIDKALASFQIADRFGLLGVPEVKLGLAIANLAKGDREAAEHCLREAWKLNPAAAREKLAEFLAAQGRQAEAEAIQ